MKIAAILAAAAAIIIAPRVHAHAVLDHSSPAVGSSITSAPGAVTMWFTQELEPAFTSATVTDASGRNVASGAAQVDPSDRTELRVPLRPLPPGTYSVAWRVLSVDTHTTEGRFTFTVGR